VRLRGPADPADPDAFAARILDVLLAPGPDRRRMKEAAVRTAKERHAWLSVAAAIAEAYAAACG
jgi:glycosyltransferase involved in cell wall biosynthesis